MKRIVRLTAALLALVILLCSCGSPAAVREETESITITDHGGNEVTVPVNAQRVAVIGIWPLPSVLTVFFNSAERIVGMPEPSLSAAQNGLLGELYPEILEAETQFITDDTINIEELMKLDPQIVFYNCAKSTYADQLREAGFTAVGISVNKWEYDCIETLNEWISLLSLIFPEDAKAQQVSEKSDEIYALVQERVSTLEAEERTRVFFLYQYTDTSILTSGGSFFGQWWADATGCINVAEEIMTDNGITVNLEQVYAWDPELIFITNFTTAQPEDIINSSIGSYDWSEIEAVKTGRVYKMPLGIYRSYTPGADAPVTLLWMAKTVYPELFEDIDIKQTAREYYKELFGVELSDAQIDSIFAPVSAAAGGVN